MNLYGRVTTLARRPVTRFEEAVQEDVPTEMLPKLLDNRRIYQKTLQLRPGRYRFTLAANDAASGKQTIYPLALDVPQIEDGMLGSSSLILADQIENVPGWIDGVSQFVIGASKVRPRVDNAFHREETLGIYLQAYNFEPDDQTHKGQGSVRYDFVKADTNEIVSTITEDVSSLPGGAAQVRLQHLMPLKNFEPGAYILKVTIVDTQRNQTVAQAADFRVL